MLISYILLKKLLDEKKSTDFYETRFSQDTSLTVWPEFVINKLTDGEYNVREYF